MNNSERDLVSKLNSLRMDDFLQLISHRFDVGSPNKNENSIPEEEEITWACINQVIANNRPAFFNRLHGYFSSIIVQFLAPEIFAKIGQGSLEDYIKQIYECKSTQDDAPNPYMKKFYEKVLEFIKIQISEKDVREARDMFARSDLKDLSSISHPDSESDKNANKDLGNKGSETNETSTSTPDISEECSSNDASFGSGKRVSGPLLISTTGDPTNKKIKVEESTESTVRSDSPEPVNQQDVKQKDDNGDPGYSSKPPDFDQVEISNEAKKAGSTDPILGTWKYVEIPANEPESHSEFFNKSIELSDGYRVMGARARGKKHKHDGTNCDDWFELATAGNWTILVVSDGAGSSKYSRIGARISCETVCSCLTENLKDFCLESRDTWSTETFIRNEKGGYKQQDIQRLQEYVHNSIFEAYKKITEGVDDRKMKTEYVNNTGGPIDIADFSSTLLIAVHTVVRYKDKNYSLTMSNQIGDGMIGAIWYDDSVHLLAKPDTGEFGGETEFLTSLGRRNKLTVEQLVPRTMVDFAPIKALLLMSDGVADDYFPNKPGMSILWGDLILNNVIPRHIDADSDIEDKDRDTIDPSTYIEKHLPLAKDDGQEKTIAYLDKLAIALNMEPLDVVANHALLEKYRIAEKDLRISGSTRLQEWLDNYYRKGSFDDRSLVVLYRGDNNG